MLIARMMERAMQDQQRTASDAGTVPAHMKAVLVRGYGDPGLVDLAEVETPRPGAHQVLVRVRAAGVNPVDWKICRGELWLFTGFWFPLRLGLDLAGEVVALGEQVTRFALGDAVYANLGFPPGSSYAEYAVVTDNPAHRNCCRILAVCSPVRCQLN
jgi:NADPH:quinone reductase-like Zn-dependent oxidoreductase